MTEIVARPLWIWLTLLAATTASFVIQADVVEVSAKVASVLPQGIAFWKARIVGLYFMDLKDASWALRLPFEIWIIAVCATLKFMFWKVRR